jgi:hypothetical protein
MAQVDECTKMEGKLFPGKSGRKQLMKMTRFWGCKGSVMESSDWASLATCYDAQTGVYLPTNTNTLFESLMYICKYDKERMRAKMC